MAMVKRGAAGLPLEHVLGWAEFCGLRVSVDPGVFVPRRRTRLHYQRGNLACPQVSTEAGRVTPRTTWRSMPWPP